MKREKGEEGRRAEGQREKVRAKFRARDGRSKSRGRARPGCTGVWLVQVLGAGVRNRARVKAMADAGSENRESGLRSRE